MSNETSIGKFQHKLTITVEPADGGHIEINGEKRDATSGVLLNAGESHGLLAVPAEGMRFVGWYMDGERLAEDDAYDFYLSKNSQLTAKFEEQCYALRVNCEKGGTVKLNGETISGIYTTELAHNATVTLTVTTDSLHRFYGWANAKTGKMLSEEETYTFVMNGDLVVVPQFEWVPGAVSITAEPAGAGLFTYGDGNTAEKIEALWEEGNRYHITVAAKEGYRFLGWQNDDTGETSASLKDLVGTLTESGLHYTAIFQEVAVNRVEITATAGGKIGEYNASGSELGTSYEKTFEGAPRRITLVAKAEIGYRFVGWFAADGTCLENSGYWEYTPAEGKHKIEARFEKDEYSFQATVSPSAGGYLTENGEKVDYSTPKKFANLTSFTLTAVANEGYVFDCWYENGERKSSAQTYTTYLVSDTVVEARFLKKCTLTVTVEPAGAGYITENGETVDYSVSGKQVISGRNVELAAEVRDGYRFIGWYDAVTGEMVMEDDRLSYTVEDNCHLVAKYEEAPFELSIDSGNGGSVKLDGVAISAQYYGSVERNTSVTLTAVPDTGMRFVGWYNKASEALLSFTVSYTLTLTENLSIQAVFERAPVSVTITMTPAGSGYFKRPDGTTCTSIDELVEIGETFRLTAVANAGYRFMRWERTDGKQQIIGAELEVKVPEGGLSYRAVFIEDPYTLVANAKTGGKLKVTAIDGVAESTPQLVSAYQKAFGKACRISLTAVPDAGYRFDGWYIADRRISNELDYLVVLSEKVELEARFEKESYKLIATAETEGSTGTGGYVSWNNSMISSMPNGLSFDAFDEVSLKAETYQFYRFKGWYDTDTDRLLSTSVTYTFRMTATTKVKAVFERIPQVTLTVTVTPSDGGYLTENDQRVDYANGKTFDEGSTVTLTAVADAAYTFKGWYNERTQTYLSQTATYTFTLRDTMSVQAVFESKPTYRFTLTVRGEGHIYKNVSEDVTDQYKNTVSVVAGTSLALTAVPDSGYHFVGWYNEDNSLISADVQHTFVCHEHVSAYAKFEENQTYLFLAQTDGGGHIEENAQMVNFGNGRAVAAGTKIKLTAVANEGCVFKHWVTGYDANGNRTVISEEETYEFTVNADAFVYAVFENPSFDENKVTGLYLDAYDAGFSYVAQEGLGLVLADVTEIGLGSTSLHPEAVVVYAEKTTGSVILTEEEYTIDLGGFDCTVAGTYYITYTYKADPTITATLTVKVKEAQG